MIIEKFKNFIFVEKKMDKHLKTKAIVAGIFNTKSCQNLYIFTSCIGCNKARHPHLLHGISFDGF